MTEQPFNYAVLMKDSEGHWVGCYQNGDLAAARAMAENCARDDAGRPFVVVQFVSMVQAETITRWSKS